jgi:uncharacterized protein
MESLTLIIKTVGERCNLRCSYCFYNKQNQEQSKIIDIRDLHNILLQIKQAHKPPYYFIWHGGEPLLSKIDYFERLIQIQYEIFDNQQDTINLIQTNGTLVSQRWAVFFFRHKFRVGISLDGDKSCNDVYRIKKDKKSSFSAVLKGIDYLRSEGIEPGVIQTITKNTLSYVPNNFDYLVDELKIKSLSTNICDTQYTQDQTIVGLTSDDVFWLYKMLFHKWLERKDFSLRIREVENIIFGLTGLNPKSCSFNGTCGEYLTIEGNQSIYPCDRLSHNPNYYLGKLTHSSYHEIVSGSRRESFIQYAHTLPDDCVICKWKNICNNGCTALRDPITKLYKYCEARKQIFSYINDIINSINLSPYGKS